MVGDLHSFSAIDRSVTIPKVEIGRIATGMSEFAKALKEVSSPSIAATTIVACVDTQASRLSCLALQDPKAGGRLKRVARQFEPDLFATLPRTPLPTVTAGRASLNCLNS